MKFLSLALLASLGFSSASFACGEEAPLVVDGMTEMEGENMICTTSKSEGLSVVIEYGWGACLTSQTASVSRNGKTRLSYANSVRGETPQHDLLLKYSSKNGNVFMKFVSKKKDVPSMTLSLKRDAKNDYKAKDYMGNESTYSAYKGAITSRGIKALVSCKELPQRH